MIGQWGHQQQQSAGRGLEYRGLLRPPSHTELEQQEISQIKWGEQQKEAARQQEILAQAQKQQAEIERKRAERLRQIFQAHQEAPALYQRFEQTQTLPWTHVPGEFFQTYQPAWRFATRIARGFQGFGSVEDPAWGARVTLPRYSTPFEWGSMNISPEQLRGLGSHRRWRGMPPWYRYPLQPQWPFGYGLPLHVRVVPQPAAYYEPALSTEVTEMAPGLVPLPASFRGLGEFVSEVTAEALRTMDLAGIGSFGQLEQVLGNQILAVLERYGPEIASKLAQVARPAAEKAVEVVKPAVTEALKEQMPVFSGVVGVLLGAAVLLGVFISRQTFRGSRRATRRRKLRRNWGWSGGWRF